MEGGHDIPEEVIIRRYRKGILNLINVFINLCDYWLIIDNSNRPYTLVAEGSGKLDTVVTNKEIWHKIKNAVYEKS